VRRTECVFGHHLVAARIVPTASDRGALVYSKLSRLEQRLSADHAQPRTSVLVAASVMIQCLEIS